jgi:uncharacterized protein YebE (UPF0316 family)
MMGNPVAQQSDGRKRRREILAAQRLTWTLRDAIKLLAPQFFIIGSDSEPRTRT